MHPSYLPFADHDIETLERATLDAVAPPAMREIDGWLLPFDDSTIGRAKSAVPVRHRNIDAGSITTISALYADRGLKAAYRVADLPGLEPIHAELSRQGYTAQQPTLVQVGTVKAMRAMCRDIPARVSATPEPAWASVYLAEGFNPVDGANRVQALSRSTHTVYACVEEDGQTVAAGTAAFSHGWCSIHGMRTLPAQRGRGLAAGILAGLADTAVHRNLERVFLQVEEGNTGARAVYQRAGFTTAWRYHYWR